MFRSIRSKVLVATICITLVTALAITIVFYEKSSAMIEENYGENLYARIRQMGDSFDELLKGVYLLTAEASCDEELLDMAEDYLSSGNADQLEAIAGQLRVYSRRYSDIGSVYLVLPGDGCIITSEDYPVYEKGIPDEKIKQIAASSETALEPVMLQDPLRRTASVLSFASAMKNQEGDTLAYIMTNIEERVLYYKYLDGLNEGTDSSAVILDTRGRIVSARDKELTGAEYGDGSVRLSDGVQDDKGGSSLKISYKSSFAGYLFFMEVEKRTILGDMRQIRYFLALILLICCAISAVIAYFITGAMYRPLSRLTRTMGQISDGNLDQRVEITTGDEIGLLSKDFNNMLEHIQALIEQLVKEEMLKKDAELEALQYQITPHFMYNTLNSIKYAALLKGEQEIGGLIEDFIELLQASINKKGNFVTVAEEIHFLENYVSLQRIRYEERFEVEYRVPDEAAGCYLPRLLLQPLVENAILHGVDMKRGGSCIVVGAEVEGRTLHLSVRDNGRGMSEKQIEVLLTVPKNKTSGLSGIGVANVKERLELYYGREGRLLYTSGEQGTTAHIYLPAYKERNQYEL